MEHVTVVAQDAVDGVSDAAAARMRKSQPTRRSPVPSATLHSAQSKRKKAQAKRKAP